MSDTAELARIYLRDYKQDGVASTGEHEPVKAEGRAVFNHIDALLTALADGSAEVQGGWNASAGTFPGGGTAQTGDVWFTSVAGTVGGVFFGIGDRVVALVDNASTGTYAGNWIRMAASQEAFIGATNAGAGTANAIIATTDRSIPPADGAALIALPLSHTNTSEDVTVALNGGTPLAVRMASGKKPLIGSMQEDAAVHGYITAGGTILRLIEEFEPRIVFAETGGTANALTLTTAGPIPSTDRKVHVIFEVTAASTGPVTAAVNGAGAVALMKADGVQADKGDLKVGQRLMAYPHDGAWWLTETLGRRPHVNAGSVGGTANAITAVLPCPVPAADEVMISIKATAASSGPVTLDIGGGAWAVMSADGIQADKGDIRPDMTLTGHRAGSTFQLTDRLARPAHMVATGVGGTANAITAQLAWPVPTTAATRITFVATALSTGPVTVNVGAGAWPVMKANGVQAGKGDIRPGWAYTGFRLGDTLQLIETLAQPLIPATNTGAGTPNAIIATLPFAVPEGAESVIALPIVDSATGPATANIGGGAWPIYKPNGEQAGEGDLLQGTIVHVYRLGATLRMVHTPFGHILPAVATGGTANMILADTPIPVPFGPIKCLVRVPVAEANTGPLFVRLNGGHALNARFGNRQVPAGAVGPGDFLWGSPEGDVFHLLNDPDTKLARDGVLADRVASQNAAASAIAAEAGAGASAASAADSAQAATEIVTGLVIADTSELETGTAGKIVDAQGGVHQIHYHARRKLLGNTFLYVREDGSDSNDGWANSAGGAVETLDRALELCDRIDVDGNVFTIKLVSGAEQAIYERLPARIVLPNMVGSRTGNDQCIIEGDTADPSKVIVRGVGSGVAAVEASRTLACNWVVDGFSVESTHASGLYADTGANKLTARRMRYGPCAANHIYCGGDVILASSQTHSIYGDAQCFVRTQIGIIRTGSATIEFEEDVNFSLAFVYAQYGRTHHHANGMTFNLNGHTVTGRRFEVRNGASMFSGTADLEYFPGSIPGRAFKGTIYHDLPTPINAPGANTFSGIKSGSAQTGIAPDTPTQVTYTVVNYNTLPTSFSGGTWQPVRGKGQLNAAAEVTAGIVAGELYELWCYRGQSPDYVYEPYRLIAQNRPGGTSAFTLVGGCQIDNDIGTDRFRIYFVGGGSGNKTIGNDATKTYMEGHMLADVAWT